MNLTEIAKKALIERGFLPEFSQEVMDEIKKIHAPALPLEQTVDRRDLFWVSIDNDDSRDLDQLTYAEKNKIFVAIADVTSLVKLGSPIDRQASHNTTSVYTPTRVFPMLPLKLCTDLTSLNENEDRCAIVVEMDVDEGGQFEFAALYPAVVRNKAKLAYNSVGAHLERGEALPLTLPLLSEQLKLQHKHAKLIKEFRDRRGALTFEKIELDLVIEKERPVAFQQRISNAAHRLIENFMIAANVGVTKFLLSQNLPVLRRVVRTPKKWPRLVELAATLGEKLPSQPNVKALRDFLLHQQKARPEQFVDLSLAVIKLIGRGEYVLGNSVDPSPGHFDLALTDYSHTTAPNRRYPDIIMQRLLKSALFKTRIPYRLQDLHYLAGHCSLMEDGATKVERQMQKSAAAIYLSTQIGQRFDAMVTGASEKGVWVRLKNPPIEGKLVKGGERVDVGDWLTVKLIHTDPVKGFIDFVKA